MILLFRHVGPLRTGPPPLRSPFHALRPIKPLMSNCRFQLPSLPLSTKATAMATITLKGTGQKVCPIC